MKQTSRILQTAAEVAAEHDQRVAALRAKRGRLTFEEICVLQPALKGLRYLVTQIRDDPSQKCFCANWVYEHGLKPLLQTLVGWKAREPCLQSPDVYQTAVKELYDLLPYCRNCGCVDRGALIPCPNTSKSNPPHAM